MTDVLVVDDQVLIRAGLAALVAAADGLRVVGEAGNGEEAVSVAAAARPDVVLMDVRMPVLDGVAATRRIRAAARGQSPRVLVLTTFDLDEYVYSALRAGASGFLLKDTPPERLISGIRVVAAGDVLVGPTVVRRLVEAYATRAEIGSELPDLSALTAREVDVLRLVGRGLTNDDIAARLVVSTATVKTHLNRTMTKLDLCSRAQAVVVAYEAGLVTPARYATAPSAGDV
ncbi:response regulator [Couchioplanes caeruleus]|uniref:LuxR family two component transcriptional regulator n=1 Tax=Couchioplanes caeruleus TaxID=56438 RepID=A0A3N1GN44_9ACTN|nr:response regulator transcription factor [Couchioplanes caeruleus]ROP31621.1 LuxR family two component transcriptional regulator [Couchioplanes caeruleus]